MWYRVFGRSEVEPRPDVVLDWLRTIEPGARVQFHADDEGWFAADLDVPGEDTTLRLERFLSTEEGIRAELNTWAAWLETKENNPYAVSLMQHMISTKQIFTLQTDPTAGDRTVEICNELCRHLARLTDGVYQADAQGFLDAQGLLLVPEDL